MNSQQPVEVLTPFSSTQCELLYATPAFQVRLWRLKPGDTIQNFPASEGMIDESQCLLAAGAISLSKDGMTLEPQQGERFTLKAAHDELRVLGNKEVCLLEISFGRNLPASPLIEITEERPWGRFTVLKDEPTYKLKELWVKPGNRLSLQRHFKREEHWFVTQGKPEVFLDDVLHPLEPGGYIHIPLQSWHRISNPEEAVEPVEIIELQLGEYFGEDDIERRQDDYGRQ